MRTLFACLLITATIFCQTVRAADIDRAVVDAALGRPINDRDTTLKDAQAFCAAKVPEMPKPKDAAAFEAYYDSKKLWPAESLERRRAVIG